MTDIFVIDDDKDMCLLISRFLTRNGFVVASAHNGREALEWINGNKPSLILCDFRLDDISGIEILTKIKHQYPEVIVIIITGYSDVKEAVEVMKNGAYDYITKPLYPDEILLTIRRALSEKLKLIRNSQNIDDKLSLAGNREKYYEKFIEGTSEEYKNVLKQIELVAPTNFSVIIYGESGSGKEMIAHQIHDKSRRKDKPFIAIDCGALSKDIAGSELFGHEKGSFTGAMSQKNGYLFLANEGTVFLDEIGNLPYDVQVSLLRVVQERKIRRIGGTKDIELDVRIIVASNENLREMARSGRFREDLFHRFNEFGIEVPPLRARKDDIMTYAFHFLRLTNSELNKNIIGFSPEVEDILINYVWYGNLRELKNVIKRAALLSDGQVIEAKSLPFEINNFKKLQFENQIVSLNIKEEREVFRQSRNESLESKLKTANIDASYEVILDALKQTNFNKSKAATLLNIDRKTLYNKMKQFKELNSSF